MSSGIDRAITTAGDVPAERHGAQRDDREHRERQEVHEGLGDDRAGDDGQDLALLARQAPAEHDDAHRLPEPAREDRRGHHADHRRARDRRTS